MGALDGSQVRCDPKFSRLALPCSKVNPQNCRSSSGRPGQGLQLGQGPEWPQAHSDCKEHSGTFEEPAWRIAAPWRRPARMAGDGIWAPNLLHVASPHAPCRAGQSQARLHSWLRFLPVEGQVSQKTGEHPPKTNRQNLCFSVSLSQQISDQFSFLQNTFSGFSDCKAATRGHAEPPQRQRKGPLFPALGSLGLFCLPASATHLDAVLLLHTRFCNGLFST